MTRFIPNPDSNGHWLNAYQPNITIDESPRQVRHTPCPESSNWYTVKRGGAWRDACADCPRIVVWTGGRWRHVR